VALDATRNTGVSGEGSTSAQSSLTGSSVHTTWLASLAVMGGKQDAKFPILFKAAALQHECIGHHVV
jgi:hypothetical protein